MSTAVSIVSNALLMLGDSPISTLNDGSDRALAAANLWPTVRQSVLRSHPWNCAIKRVSLVRDTTGPIGDWSYQYTLPGDFLRALSVGEIGAEADYKIEGRKLLCDESACMLRYVFDNDVPATWDAMLVDLVTVTMAARLAYAITKSTTLAAELADRAEVLARRARSVDGQDDSADALMDSPLLRARYLGTGRSDIRGP